MLRKTVYPHIKSFLESCAKTLHQQGFTPNQLTLGGCAINFIAGCLFATGHLFLGGIVMLLAGIGDMLDGPLARVSGKTSKFGAFLDSTIDRYSDFFLFGGLCVFFARISEGGWLIITLGILLGTFVISYAKSRAETLGEPCNVGFFERTERIIALAVGTILWGLLPVILWILLIGTHFTAIHRILHIKKALSKPEESSS